MISLHSKVTYPFDFIKLTPILFRLWQDWTEIYEEEKQLLDNDFDKVNKSGPIKAIGALVAPSWVRDDFKTYEEFYQYYCELLNIGE